MLASTLFVYLAFEAFLNDLGARICPEVWANERATFASSGAYHGTLGKFDYLLKTCGLAFDRGTRPYQTLTELDTRRDILVHGRTFSMDQVIEYVEPKQPRWKQPPLQALVDPEFLKRAAADVEQVCDALHFAARPLAKQMGAPVDGDRAFYGPIHRHWAWVEK